MNSLHWPAEFDRHDEFAFGVTAIDLEERLSLKEPWAGLYWLSETTTEGGKFTSLLDRELGGGRRVHGIDIMRLLGQDRAWEIKQESEGRWTLSYTDGLSGEVFELTPVLPVLEKALTNPERLAGLSISIDPMDCDEFDDFSSLKGKVCNELKAAGFDGLTEEFIDEISTQSGLFDVVQVVCKYVELELNQNHES